MPTTATHERVAEGHEFSGEMFDQAVVEPVIDLLAERAGEDARASRDRDGADRGRSPARRAGEWYELSGDGQGCGEAGAGIGVTSRLLDDDRRGTFSLHLSATRHEPDDQEGGRLLPQSSAHSSRRLLRSEVESPARQLRPAIPSSIRRERDIGGRRVDVANQGLISHHLVIVDGRRSATRCPPVRVRLRAHIWPSSQG